MAGSSFSLTEKLAVTGAFLALVALVVGTEDDPGVVVTGQETVKDMRLAAPPVNGAPRAEMPRAAPSTVLPPQSASETLPAPTVPLLAPPTSPAASETPQTEIDKDEGDDQFSTKLGRVPRDFSKGPPGS